MEQTDNSGQEAFWNTGPGQNWVAHQAEMDALLADVTDLLLRECAPLPGEAILDIGCGAGASSLALAAVVGAAGHVLGIDISAPLLERAEELRRAADLGNTGFLLGDAQTHPLPEGRFDAAASRFGVMFFADPVAAFRNITKALRPGGRMVLLAWAGPESNPWLTLPAEIAAARLGAASPSPPDAPGPMAFRDISRVLGILEAAGLAECSGESRRVELRLPGIAAAVALATQIGPAPRLLREKGATAEDMAAVEAGIETAFAPFTASDGVRVPAELNLFGARRA